MKMTSKICILLFSVFVVLIQGCTKDKFVIFCPFEDGQEMSFKNDIQPIFTKKCATSGCHVDGHSTGLDLTEGKSYSLLVDVTSKNYPPDVRIKTNDPGNSVLWNKIKGTDIFGNQMPFSRTPLLSCDIKKIEMWIAQGAKNN